jgi:cell division protein FtsZ
VLTAAVAAVFHPLIEDPSIKRASGLIISITGGRDPMLFEIDEAATRIRGEADPDANIIVGASFDESLGRARSFGQPRFPKTLNQQLRV